MDGYDNEELTEAELEDIRRERAATRRRKLAARERRRRERRRQAIIRCSILLIILILIITGIVKMISGIWKHFHKNKEADKVTEEMISTEATTTEEPVAEIDESIIAKELPADRDAALALLQAQAESDPDMMSICENAAVYPDKLLQCLAVNSEMKQFVLDYLTKISIVFDGNFSVDVPEDEVPLFLQYDEQWGYADYGSSIIGINGCGPTCLSMAYTYLKQDGSMNPIKVADFSVAGGYLDEQGDTNWALMTDGARTLGLTSEELALSKDNMITALENGKVIICSMSPGDFTRNGHFIVIREYKEGFFYVNDPNSQARSEVGWDYKRLSTQISNMWALGVGSEDPGSSEQSSDSQADNTGSDDQTDSQSTDGQADSSQNSNEQTNSLGVDNQADN